MQIRGDNIKYRLTNIDLGAKKCKRADQGVPYCVNINKKCLDNCHF